MMAANSSDVYVQGSKVGAKAAAPAGRSVLDMLARGKAHIAERVAPAPAADSQAPAPATAPQHSRQAPTRAEAAVSVDSGLPQPDAELALRPKRLFLSQTADSGLTADDSEAALSGHTSGSPASEGIGPARDGAQRPRRNDADGEAVSRAFSREMRADGGGTGEPSGRERDDAIDLVTPPALAEPGGGRDGNGSPGPIVVLALSSSSCSEQRADTPATPSITSDANAPGLTAAALASRRLGTEPAAVDAGLSAAAQSQSQVAAVTRQEDTLQRGTAADSSSAAISAVEARSCVGTLDMTRVGRASWLLDTASPFSDIVIDLDTPSTGPASVQTPALAGHAGRKGGRERRVGSPG